MSLLAPLRGEWFRMRATRSMRFVVLVPAIAGVLRILGGRLAERVDEARRVTQGLAGGGAQANGFGALADGLRAGGATLALVLLVLGAMAYARDRENGSLAQWTLAASRTTVVGTRALGLLSFLFVAFTLLALATIACAALLFDLGDVLEEGHVMAEAGELWLDALRACAASLPALFAAGLFGLLVSTFAPSTGAAVGITLIPFVLFDLLRALVPDAAGAVFVTYVPFLGDGSPLAHFTDIARAYSDAFWEEGELRAAVSVPLLEGLLLLFLAMIVGRARPAT